MLVARCGYVLLAVATILGLLEGPADAAVPAHDARDRRGRRRPGSTSSSPGCRSRGGTIACAWRVLRRGPGPRLDPHAPPAGLLHLHDQRLLLRLGPAAAAARGRRGRRDVHPREHPHHRPAADDRGVDLLPRRSSVVQTVVDRRRGGTSARRSPSRTRSAGRRWRELEAATIENAGLHAQLLTQAREAGVLDERQRMAREIHDTIAQGLIGIVTQLEAADQARDRPGRPGPAPRQRRAAGAREPDRGAPLGRGIDARRARGRDAARTRWPTSRASGPRSTASRSRSTSPARSSPSTRRSRWRSCASPRRRWRTSRATPAPRARG